MLRAERVGIEVGARVLLDAATLTVRQGSKIGLVGRNGAGKSTLMKVLAGLAQPAQGSVSAQGRIAYFAQHLKTEPDAAPDGLTHILEARGLATLEADMQTLLEEMERDPRPSVIEAFSDAQERFGQLGGYEADAEIAAIAGGLAIEDDDLLTPLAALSGGERRRVELAAILYGGTDVLLLDEPTNHLDADAKTWLLEFLRAYEGGLLVISHDLVLLDDAITEVLHLDEGQLHAYKGTYSGYLRARAAHEERLQRLHGAQQAQIDRLATLADRMRHQSVKRARAAKSIDRRVERLESARVTVAGPSRELDFTLPDPPRSGRLVLAVEELTKGYVPGDPLLTRLSLDVLAGERILVLGPNGAGKTTLLRTIVGLTSADEGTVRFGTNVSCGYYAQEHDAVDWGSTALEHLQGTLRDDGERRRVLGLFGLRGDVAFQAAGTLSGGERTKLALARLVVGGHNLLLLDEPTNHLDPASREAVGRALSTWPGTMLLVSHDEAFVEALSPNRVLRLPGGRINPWRDDMLSAVAVR